MLFALSVVIFMKLVKVQCAAGLFGTRDTFGVARFFTCVDDRISSYLPAEDVSQEPPEKDKDKQTPRENWPMTEAVKSWESVPKQIGQDQEEYHRQQEKQCGIVVEGPRDIQVQQGMQSPLGATARALHAGRPEEQTLRERRFGRVKFGIDIQKEESEQYQQDKAHLLQYMLLSRQSLSTRMHPGDR